MSVAFSINIVANAVGAQGAITGVERSLRSLDDQAKRSGALLNKMFRAGAALAVGAELLSLTDTYTTLAARIAVVTDTQSQANAVMERVFQVANNARVPVEAVANTYSRLRQATETLGISQEKSLKMTETLAKGLRVNGASASEAASTMRQFTQALSKGKLNGDEFISVMENSPAVVKLIGKELGVTRGELFALAKAGKISARTMVDALTNGAEGIDKAFSKMPLTIGQAFTVLRNNAVKFIGELTTSSGVARGLAESIAFVARHFEEFGKIVLAVAYAVGEALAVRAVYKLISSLKALYVVMLANPYTAIIAVITFLIGLLINFGDQIKLTADGSVTLADVISEVWFEIKRVIVSAVKVIGSAFESMLTFIDEGFRGLNVTFGDVLVLVAIFIDKFVALFEFAGAAIIAILVSIPAAGGALLLEGLSYLLQGVAAQMNLFVTAYNKTVGRLAGKMSKFTLGSGSVMAASKELEAVGKAALGNAAEKWDNFTGSDVGPVQAAMERILNSFGMAKKANEDLNKAGKDTFKDIPGKAGRAKDAFEQLLERLYPTIKALDDLRDAKSTVDKELAKGVGTDVPLSIEEIRQATLRLNQARKEGLLGGDEYAQAIESLANQTKKINASRISDEQGNQILDRQRYLLLETADALGHYNYVAGQELDLANQLAVLQDSAPAAFAAEIEARKKLNDLIDKGIVLSEFELQARESRGVDTADDRAFRESQLDLARNSARVAAEAGGMIEAATDRNKRYADRLQESITASSQYAAELQEIAEQYNTVADGAFNWKRAMDELDKKFGVTVAAPAEDPRIQMYRDMTAEIERMAGAAALLQPIFSSLEAQITSFVTTGKASFSDMVNSILSDLTQLILKIIETRLMMAILGATSGAPISQMTPFGTQLMPAAFAADGGSFLVGGQAGRDRNIVPMGLSRGEDVRVRTKLQRQQDERGDQREAPPRLNVTVINQQDPGSMVPVLGSRAGQRQIYNSMRLAPRSVGRLR